MLSMLLVIVSVIMVPFGCVFVDEFLARRGIKLNIGVGVFSGILGVAALNLFATAVARLRPTYYRVVPGRIDVLRFGLLRRQPLQVEHIDLRNAAQIVIEFDHAKIRISEGIASNERVLKLNDAAEPHRLAEAVVQAAISTYPAAPLPDDDLTG